jgi:AraC-like DNA-binding protein
VESFAARQGGRGRLGFGVFSRHRYEARGRRDIDDGKLIEALIAGAQAGLALAVGAAMALSRLSAAVRTCGALAALAYGLNCLANSPAGDMIERIRFVWIAIAVFSSTAGGLVWVMVVSLFDDKPVRPALFIPASVLALATVVLVTTHGVIRSVAFWTANLFALAVFLHALYLLARGRAGDLVESRRRLRRPLVWACLAMGLAEIAVLLFAQDRAHAWITRTVSIAEMIAFAGLAGAMLELRRAVFDAPPSRQPREDADGDLVKVLYRLMDEQRPWAEEGLGIGDLADRLGAPEHRLRKVINGRLGYRNFPSFVNGYRIEAAKRRLSDPAEKDRSVAEIAFDLGFTSLSPFNRAFKEVTGLTPSEWRRRPTE